MPHRNPKNDLRAVSIGALLIFLVGAYFIGRSIWFSENQKRLVEETKLQEDRNTPTITAILLREKIRNQEKFVLVDIRAKEAYDAEHIPQAVSVAGGDMSAYEPKEEGTSVVIISSAQDEAATLVAKETLKRKKFAYYFLEGGFEAWKSGSNQTLSYGDPTSFIDQSKVTFISVEEFKGLIASPDSNLFILDVQPEADFEKKHIKGAVNIPVDELERRASEITPARQVVVYGKNELVSFQAGVRLFDLNVFAARTLEGNAVLTPASGLPLEP